MTFRFAARYVLLTYAQCGDLDPFEVVRSLGDLGAECIIGREDHADGGCHLHAFADFKRKFQSRNVRIFDVDGKHPNVQPCKTTPEQMYDYAIKDGDIVAGGLTRPDGTSVSEAGSKWTECLLAESREEFFETVARVDPRALCCSFSSLRAYADWKYRPIMDAYQTPVGISFDTTEVPQLSQWIQRNLEVDRPGMSCTSRTGHPPRPPGFGFARGPRLVLSSAPFHILTWLSRTC